MLHKKKNDVEKKPRFQEEKLLVFQKKPRFQEKTSFSRKNLVFKKKPYFQEKKPYFQEKNLKNKRKSSIEFFGYKIYILEINIWIQQH